MSDKKTQPRVVRYTGRRKEDITDEFWGDPELSKRAREKAQARAQAAQARAKPAKPSKIAVVPESKPKADKPKV